MDYKRTIALVISLVVLKTNAQPFQPAELAWPSQNTNNFITFLPPNAQDSLFILPQDSRLDAFVIASDPQNILLNCARAVNVSHGILAFLGLANHNRTNFSYVPDASFVGNDFFTYQVNNTYMFSTGKVSLLMYATNSGSSACGVSSSAGIVLVRFPPVPMNYSATLWAYTSLFTNLYVWIPGASSWTGPPTIIDDLAFITVPTSNTSVCIVYSNTPPFTCVVTEDPTNVVYSGSFATGNSNVITQSLVCNVGCNSPNGNLTWSLCNSSLSPRTLHINGKISYVLTGGANAAGYTFTISTNSGPSACGFGSNAGIPTLTDWPINCTITLPPTNTMSFNMASFIQNIHHSTYNVQLFLTNSL